MNQTIRDLPLNALRAFAVVCDQGGIRAAARELGVAHSALSRHLAELEKWLGVPLAQSRGGRRGLVLSPQGEALGRTALAALGELGRAAASLREARSASSVIISTTPSFAARWLLPRLPALEQAQPRLEISVVVDQKPIDLDESEADLAIRMGKGPWRDLTCRPLMDERLYPVMSPSFWRRAGRPERPAQLARLRLLHDRDPNASWELWRKAHGPAALDVRAGPRFASSDLVLRAAAQGQGVALARHRLAADDVAAGVLVRPMGELSVVIESAYWLVLPSNRSLRPAAQAVVDWLERQAAYPHARADT